MKSEKQWAFDVSVGWEEPAYNTRQAITLAREYMRKKEYEAARILLERVSNSAPAKFELAKFYRDTPQLQVEQKTRYKKAEALLLGLEQDYDIPEICMELSELYRLARKPLSSFGYLLRGKRLGANVPEKSIEAVWTYIERMDVNTTTVQDPHGAYVLGYEASLMGAAKYSVAIWLLQEAVDNGSGAYVGIAALELSELFEMHGNRALAKEYRDKAAACGYPSLLVHKPA